MPTVVFTVEDGADLPAEMGRMRTWFDANRCAPGVFKYWQDGGCIVIEVEVNDQETAKRFKKAFGGYDGISSGFERRFTQETMETVCWWRLRAEEIRAEAEEFRSREARRTLTEVARSYDRMAENLERRLTDPRYRDGLIVRFA